MTGRTANGLKTEGGLIKMDLMGQIKEICMEYKNCERCPFTIGKTKDVEFDCYFTYMLPSDWSFDWIEKQIYTR